MEFVLSLISEEQKMLRDTVVKLCRGKLKELDDKVGETNIVNRGILEFLGSQGLWGLPYRGNTAPGRIRCPWFLSAWSGENLPAPAPMPS